MSVIELFYDQRKTIRKKGKARRRERGVIYRKENEGESTMILSMKKTKTKKNRETLANDEDGM